MDLLRYSHIHTIARQKCTFLLHNTDNIAQKHTPNEIMTSEEVYSIYVCMFQVLFADGTVSTSPDSGPVCVLVPHMPLEEAEPIKELTVDTKDTKDKKGSN